MLRKIRITLAVIFFIGITLLFLDFTGTLHHWLGWMAKVQFLPAVLALNVVVILALVILTLIFGRIYCSVICPLGVMQDILARLRWKKNKYSYSKPITWLRYTMLGVMVLAIVLGIASIVQLLAPYSSFGRIAQSLLQPIWMWANNLLAGIAERADSYSFYTVDVWIKSMPVLIIAIATLLIVGGLAIKNGRTYCNTICPVGTVLGFLARFSFFKVRFIEDKCKNCSLCSKNCKASCIDYKTHTVDYSRCVTCGNCISKCKFGALIYAHSVPTAAQTVDSPSVEETIVEEKKGDAKAMNTPDKGRRSFLLATALVATAVIAQEKKKVDGGLAKIEEKKIPARKTPITPPGSMSAANMAKRCTGCQLCVSDCPNGVLRPSTELMTIMQPVMSYERGYCRPECTRCSEVCPTGAIKPITREEKAETRIGHAVVIQENCLMVTKGLDCGNCARHCPAEAIDLVQIDENDENSPFVPSVDAERCIGCGACENLCPVRPFSAIYVEGHDVHSVRGER